ncbi:MAG: hypothetical protein KC427_00950 [Sulfurovum sp.]|uniref:hypothetical protein n=1 Tax=Sulfurovum sp. TaxID=1969726 RepID=UPI002867CF47|nr:hypothetical protein [Sulfurovum sp.]MCO4844566.1 hypothetical protein [Sulfurovum sp.]
MLSAIKYRLLSLLQLLLVITYIIFEELIWEGIAKPIYEAIHALKILQKVEAKLESVNPSVILVIFVVLLTIVEAFGIYAGMLFVSGQVFLGLTLYISKIPIAAFTFWLFRVTEDKLMQFGWFKWVYDWIMKAIDWIKSSEIHQKTMAYFVQTKTHIKALKEKYFANKSPFIEKIKQLYKTVKASLRK